MSESFERFTEGVQSAGPRLAVVLGSGLGGVAANAVEVGSIRYGSIPGVVPPTVPGHSGRVVLAHWQGQALLICHGRVHFYEGHSPDQVTALVRVLAGWGVKRLILTNAAGGIHPALGPGELMAIRGHVKMLGPASWRELAHGRGLSEPYSPRLLGWVMDAESARGRRLLTGIYVAMTGPSYETRAEVRALQRLGFDAVGMSTALEAEAAHHAGLEVAAISCITNHAAGLAPGTLDHHEVLVNAQRAVARLTELVGDCVAIP